MAHTSTEPHDEAITQRAALPKRPKRKNGRHEFEPSPGSNFCLHCGYDRYGTMKHNVEGFCR